MKSGLSGVATKLENRQQQFRLCLLSLPQGDQVREIVGAPTGIRRRLVNTLTYTERTESTVLLEEPESLNVELIQEEEAEAQVHQQKI